MVSSVVEWVISRTVMWRQFSGMIQRSCTVIVSFARAVSPPYQNQHNSTKRNCRQTHHLQLSSTYPGHASRAPVSALEAEPRKRDNVEDPLNHHMPALPSLHSQCPPRLYRH